MGDVACRASYSFRTLVLCFRLSVRPMRGTTAEELANQESHRSVAAIIRWYLSVCNVNNTYRSTAFPVYRSSASVQISNSIAVP
jgi:hypothetical protein